jgi:hypothetical protein
LHRCLINVANIKRQESLARHDIGYARRNFEATRRHKMEHALKDISFDEWVAHVFDHEVPGQQATWYFDCDSDYWDGPPDVTIEYITRLFENPVPYLQQYSDEQLNQGFWYLVPNSGSDHMFALLDEQVPIEARKRCVRSFYSLFEQLIAKICSPYLSHLNEPDVNPLNSACYMWWDLIPIHGKPNDPARQELDQEILIVIERILNIDSIACQESALHGLGHWEIYYPDQVHKIIDNFITSHLDSRVDLLNYAKQARTGYVL